MRPLKAGLTYESRPPRSTLLPFALPSITDSEISAVIDVLKSGWLTTGARTKEFEQAFADYLGVAHAVALNSGTAALHLALEAIGLEAKDEVIVPTYTFAASAEVVRYFGARPVLVDVRASDLNIDVDAVSASITPRTRAVIGVDIGGQPCDWDWLAALAERQHLALIDDAAHAFPSRLQGRLVGTWAGLTMFSFYATKPLATGEGGMLVTNDHAQAERARLMSLHGLSHDAWKRYTGEGSWYYEIVAPGFKYNMTDIAAALGLAQLRRVDTMLARRAAIARAYTAAFLELPELEVPTELPDRTTSWHLYMLRLNLDRLRVGRAEFVRHLADERIATSVHFIPLHCHPYYRDTYGFRPESFPIAYREYQREISLPIYAGMSDGDVDDVIAAVCRVVAAHRR